MRRATSLLLAATLAMTGAVYVFGPSLSGAARINGGAIASETPGSAMTEAQVLAVVADAGSLLRADEDAYAASFNASGFSSDGGTGGTVWSCGGPSCKYKFAEGSSMEMTAGNNELDWSAVSMQKFATISAQAQACRTNQSCYDYADPGFWRRDFPTSDTTGCAAGTEGGHKARSTDNRWVYCDGTTVQILAFRGGPWSGAIDFAAAVGVGCQTGTFTATGAVTDEPIAVGGCGSVVNADADYTCSAAITATNTATVQICCQDVGGCANPASITFSAAALR